ncbi:hypothetical protein RM697_05055 [Ichthyenterobacterium sp. W332]|uniref:Uncharacterized protein n=1 Tax=Microcosmobacter mediterraneus TaxID=3075607 RepID=A0ABU2YIL9_9FLAO|nr:hypothetical protein [Ichthyenterobacterium sp. W332]MDT0558001.1 hypothetical protein [Ichthyenterobacterium sp. W332]
MNNIFTYIAIFSCIGTSVLAQGNNPPPPIPPPPPGLPISDWIPFFVAIGLIYGSYKIVKRVKTES